MAHETDLRLALSAGHRFATGKVQPVAMYIAAVALLALSASLQRAIDPAAQMMHSKCYGITNTLEQPNEWVLVRNAVLYALTYSAMLLTLAALIFHRREV